MNENEYIDNTDMFGINRTSYLVWLNPQITPEQLSADDFDGTGELYI